MKIAHELDIKEVTLGVMLGKAVKLAAGHLDTHSRKTTMDKAFISEMLEEAGIHLDISTLTLARELWEKIPEQKILDFASTIIRHCESYCRTAAMTGAPIRAVTELTGKAPSKPGIRAIRLQNKANTAPQRAVAGMSTR